MVCCAQMIVQLLGEKFLVLATVTFLFVFGNYYPIMDYIGSKDSSTNYVIIYFFIYI
jgi:hypothetical protein